MSLFGPIREKKRVRSAFQEAQHQAKWPRYFKALELRRKEHLTYKQIGKRMSISHERARQLVIYAEREEKRRAK